MSFEHPLWREIQQGGNPPVVMAETGDFFDIEFPRAAQLANTPETGGQKGGQEGGQEGGQSLILTERQQEVVALLQETPGMTRQAMADALGINPSAVQKHLDKLKQAGAIERIGGTRGHWKVKV